jgi:putative acyl-CoA dehydrogenase
MLSACRTPTSSPIRPPFIGHNPAASLVLVEALVREGGGWGLSEVTELGALSGTAQAQRWGELADRNVPILHTHDRYGHRVDEIEYDPPTTSS